MKSGLVPTPFLRLRGTGKQVAAVQEEALNNTACTINKSSNKSKMVFVSLRYPWFEGREVRRAGLEELKRGRGLFSTAENMQETG